MKGMLALQTTIKSGYLDVEQKPFDIEIRMALICIVFDQMIIIFTVLYIMDLNRK